MTIPTEPIGSIPRPLPLIEAAAKGDSEDPRLNSLYEEAVRDTVKQFEATGSPVITDGEQRKYHNFWTYWLREHETEIRRCLDKGAHKVQVDFTEGRLAMKIDPSGNLLNSFIDLNNLALSRFSSDERSRIGIHTCPGGDRDSTHSADVDYAELLPSLFELKAGNFYIALAGEKDRVHALKIIRQYMKPDQRIFVGVVAPIDPRVESPEDVRDRTLEAAEYIPIEQLGTTDDCGFSPFCDDTSTTREVAFQKIRARVAGTALAAEIIGAR